MKKKILIAVLSVMILGAASFLFIRSKSKPVARELKEADRSTSFHKDFDSSYYAELSKLGFSSNDGVKSLRYITERKKWMAGYGLYFLGDEEMSKFLNDNDFIIGPADKYLGEVPKEAGEKMAENFSKAFSREIYRVYTDDIDIVVYKEDFAYVPERDFCNGNSLQDYFSREIIEKYRIPSTSAFCINKIQGSGIHIISGAKDFNTEGMILKNGILEKTPPVDPIAVVRVAGGWVELTSW